MRRTGRLGLIASALLHTALLTTTPLLAACGPSAPSERATLEPLHGTIDPAVLEAPPPTAPAGVDRPGGTDGGTDVEWRADGVIDGQTLRISSTDGDATVRLAGIEVPTGDDCLSELATDSLRFVVGGGRPLVVQAEIDTGSNPTTRPGHVETLEGDDLGIVMLTLGLARLDPTTIDDDRRAAYTEAQAAARSGEVGIWDPDACES